MNDIKIIKNIKIEDMIYEIRGKHVMLDSDLAYLYNCKNGTKSINLAVKRNINRFPEDFCFRLTQAESNLIWFQIETKKVYVETRGGKYNNPIVFTEEGVAMLASVIHTDIAVQRSIEIMRTFVTMKKYISSSLLEQRYINNMVNNIDKRIERMKNEFNLRTMVVATINDKIVGFAEYIDSNKYSSDYDVDCELCGLYIDKDYKGKGIGTKLFNYVANSFASMGKEKMIVWCLEDNVPAIKFYMIVRKWAKIAFMRKIEIGNKTYNEIGFTYDLK